MGKSVASTGIEPVSEAPETSILSIELRSQFFTGGEDTFSLLVSKRAVLFRY